MERDVASAHLDWDKIAEMAHNHCTIHEIAGAHDLSVRTMTRRCLEDRGVTFDTFVRMCRSQGKADLRSIQYSLASNSAAMAKHLGIQYLGQSDKVMIQREEAPEAKYDYSLLTLEELETLETLLNKCKANDTEADSD